MTTDQYIDKLRNGLSLIEKGFALSVSTTHARQVQRIFVEGLNADGNQIGQYKTTRPYYSNGKRYENYPAYRQARGRQTGFIDLKLEGSLHSDYSTSLAAQGRFSWITGVKNKANAVKIEGAEERFGSIFDLTQGEKELLVETAQYEFKKAMS